MQDVLRPPAKLLLYALFSWQKGSNYNQFAPSKMQNNFINIFHYYVFTLKAIYDKLDILSRKQSNTPEMEESMAEIFTTPPVPETEVRTQQPANNNSTDSLYDNAEIIRAAEQKKINNIMKAYRSMTVCMLIISIALAICLIVTSVGWLREEGKTVTNVETVEVIKEVEVPAYKVIDPYNDYSHRLSEDGFLLNDSSYGPIWMPALADVPKSSYDPDLFVKGIAGWRAGG